MSDILDEELEELFQEAINVLNKMNDHHPPMVWYSEAKLLYKLIPDIVDILEWARKLPYQPEQEIFINLLEKIIGEANE